MKCPLCKENKLSKEFPFYPLTENCDHPLLHCLDCVTACVKLKNKCSQCGSPATEDSEIYQEYLETLDFLFPPEEDRDHREEQLAKQVTLDCGGTIVVTTLSGESVTLTYRQSKTILEIKKEVQKELKVPSEKQRLLYEKKELKVSNNRQMLTLEDYNVQPGSIFYLVIILCAVPEHLDHVVFDFHWGLPPGRSRDYLDVSVFVYSGGLCLGFINHRYPERYFCPGVTHSGHADMNHFTREGHQRVDVLLKSIPVRVDKLVFTLSAWASSSISAYPYSRLQFYDVKFPDKQLCDDEMNHVKHCEAVIFCCLSKEKGGVWKNLSLKEGASGCTKNYRPLKSEISSLIQRGFLDFE